MNLLKKINSITPIYGLIISIFAIYKLYPKDIYIFFVILLFYFIVQVFITNNLKRNLLRIPVFFLSGIYAIYKAVNLETNQTLWYLAGAFLIGWSILYTIIIGVLVYKTRKKKKKNAVISLEKLSLTAEKILSSLMNSMKNKDGRVQIESLLVILSSLAGFSCQMAIREGLIKTGKIAEKKALVEVVCKNGRKYYMGDLLNAPIVNDRLSIYSIVGGAIKSPELQNMPDIENIFRHVSETIGTEDFGIPRMPEGTHKAGDIPINYLKALWPHYYLTLQNECASPQEWPIVLSIAVQKAIIIGKDTISPENAFRIVMETSIPTSKIDPQTI